jgi:hypothetical protein
MIPALMPFIFFLNFLLNFFFLEFLQISRLDHVGGEHSNRGALRGLPWFVSTPGLPFLFQHFPLHFTALEKFPA